MTNSIKYSNILFALDNVRANNKSYGENNKTQQPTTKSINPIKPHFTLNTCDLQCLIMQNVAQQAGKVSMFFQKSIKKYQHIKTSLMNSRTAGNDASFGAVGIEFIFQENTTNDNNFHRNSLIINNDNYCGRLQTKTQMQLIFTLQ